MVRCGCDGPNTYDSLNMWRVESKSVLAIKFVFCDIDKTFIMENWLTS